MSPFKIWCNDVVFLMSEFFLSTSPRLVDQGCSKDCSAGVTGVAGGIKESRARAFPYRAGGFMINPPPMNEGCCRGRQVGRDEQDGFD